MVRDVLMPDIIVGVLVHPPASVRTADGDEVSLAELLSQPPDTPLLELLGTLPWPESFAGFYYVKPNYPGRSAHNCNAGFLLPRRVRGRGVGTRLGESYLKYGPALGYRASVFNLVYETNQASFLIWKRLGFEVVGRVPGAGRLRIKDEDGPGYHEEYVDAFVIYKAFV